MIKFLYKNIFLLRIYTAHIGLHLCNVQNNKTFYSNVSKGIVVQVAVY